MEEPLLLLPLLSIAGCPLISINVQQPLLAESLPMSGQRLALVSIGPGLAGLFNRYFYGCI